MIINVQAKKGVVVESPQTAYSVGNIKWNEIVAQDKKYFRYEEWVVMVDIIQRRWYLELMTRPEFL